MCFCCPGPQKLELASWSLRQTQAKRWRSDRTTDPKHEKAFAGRIFDQEALLRMEDEGAPRKLKSGADLGVLVPRMPTELLN